MNFIYSYIIIYILYIFILYYICLYYIIYYIMLYYIITILYYISNRRECDFLSNGSNSLQFWHVFIEINIKV